jgi:hypothetical protein
MSCNPVILFDRAGKFPEIQIVYDQRVKFIEKMPE